MYIDTNNRMARGLDYPSLVGPGAPSVLAGALEAPGSSYQVPFSNPMSGLGSVISDLTNGNFSNLPSSFVSGLNPANFDIGSYLIVGGLLWMMLGHRGKTASRQLSRRARLKGAIAQDQTLLSGS